MPSSIIPQRRMLLVTAIILVWSFLLKTIFKGLCVADGLYDLQSIDVGCIYKEAKNHPDEPAAHVAIRRCNDFLKSRERKSRGYFFVLLRQLIRRLLPASTLLPSR
ncbi:hypothetical protein MKW92_050635 [Papaver armeniacum]|nr:hypothetical protein MKW92_050635 [Papaver armeniacum]